MIQFVNEYVPSDNNKEIKSLRVYKDTEQKTCFGILSFVKGNQYVVSENTIDDTIRSYRLMKAVDSGQRSYRYRQSAKTHRY